MPYAALEDKPIEIAGRNLQHAKYIDGGSEGVVELYIDAHTDEQFAVKFFFTMLSQEATSGENEIKVLNYLKEYGHPRIIRPVHVEKGATNIIVFPFYNAGDLDEYTRRTFPPTPVQKQRGSTPYQFLIPLEFKWHVFIQLIQAVGFLHCGLAITGEKTIPWTPHIHRDIWGKNILVDESSVSNDSLYPDLVLTDFGRACSYDECHDTDGKSKAASEMKREIKKVAEAVLSLTDMKLRVSPSKDQDMQAEMQKHMQSGSGPAKELMLWLDDAFNGHTNIWKLYHEAIPIGKEIMARLDGTES